MASVMWMGTVYGARPPVNRRIGKALAKLAWECELAQHGRAVQYTMVPPGAAGVRNQGMNVFGLARGVTVNLFVLLGFVALWGMVRGWDLLKRRSWRSWPAGLLFGFMAVVAMMVPVATDPGVMFDSRAGIIGAAALFGGPWTALFSLPFPVAYRLHVGGVGMIPGVAEMVLPALLGAVCHRIIRRRSGTFSLRAVVLASLAIGLGANLIIYWLLIMPSPEVVLLTGQGHVVLVLLNAPVSMAVVSALLLFEIRREEAVATAADRERRMLHSQKMVAVGQLGRKVAHRVANALTGVMVNAELAREEAAPGSDIAQLMDQIKNAVAPVTHLAGELLAFSTPGALKIRRLELGKCVLGVRRILDEAAGSQIELVLEVAAEGVPVMVDPDRIEQAIVHLVVNAVEAIPERGRVTLRVAPVDLSEEQRARLQAGVPERHRHRGRFGLLSVQDTGCGMSEATLNQIFEPFFTTKARRDAGLGLTTVYNIVLQHNGLIDVQSRPGEGTLFSVYLPLAEGE